MFRVGMKVVCIRVPRGGFGGEALPVPSKVYTVRGYRDFGYGRGIVLEEIVNPPLPYSTGLHEPHFSVKCFRPLVTRKTDISIFTHILDDVSRKQRERA